MIKTKKTNKNNDLADEETKQSNYPHVHFEADYPRGEAVGLPSEHEPSFVYPRDIDWVHHLEIRTLETHKDFHSERLVVQISPTAMGQIMHYGDFTFLSRSVNSLRVAILRELPVFSGELVEERQRPANLRDMTDFSTNVGLIPLLGCQAFLIDGKMNERLADTEALDVNNCLTFHIKTSFDPSLSVFPDTYQRYVAREKRMARELRKHFPPPKLDALVSIPDSLQPPIHSLILEDTPAVKIMTSAKRQELGSEDLVWDQNPVQLQWWLDYHSSEMGKPDRLREILNKENWSDMSEASHQSILTEFGPRFQPNTTLLYLQEGDAVDMTIQCVIKRPKSHGRHLSGSIPFFRDIQVLEPIGTQVAKGRDALNLYVNCPSNCFELVYDGEEKKLDSKGGDKRSDPLDIEDWHKLLGPHAKVKANTGVRVAREHDCTACGKCTPFYRPVSRPDNAQLFSLSSHGSLDTIDMMMMARSFLMTQYKPLTTIQKVARVLMTLQDLAKKKKPCTLNGRYTLVYQVDPREETLCDKCRTPAYVTHDTLTVGNDHETRPLLSMVVLHAMFEHGSIMDPVQHSPEQWVAFFDSSHW